MKQKKFFSSRVGMRMVKSAIAVALCYLVFYLRESEGILIYEQLAALWCIQTYTSDMKKNAVQRISGTVVGAIFGLLVLVFQQFVQSRWGYPFFLHSVIVSVMVIVVLYTTVLLDKKEISYFSCVVFLSIVVSYVHQTNPYMFAWNRFLDTVIGIVIGVGVNSFSLPKNRQEDTLFVSGMDDILFDEQEQMTDYSIAELNRMLDKGINFTISTVRTPAVVAELMKDIRLRLPIIAMDGAVLYDIVNKEYQKVYVISGEMSKNIMRLVRKLGIYCYVNVIIDDMLVIYYDGNMKPAQKELVERMRRSPYRNYVRRPVPPDEEVVYFLIYDEKEIVETLYASLSEEGYDQQLKISMYDSIDTPDYSYLKIYNKNANKANMIEYLKEYTGLEKTVTFGSVPDKYDIVVEMGDVNKVVQTVKGLYEPIMLPWKGTDNCHTGGK